MANKNSLSKAASNAGAKFFSSADNTDQKKEKISGVASLNKKEATEKKIKQVFSFRGEKDDVKAWRLYATVTGTKVDDLGSLAMQEYLANHPLKGAEKALFDEKMK